MAGIRVVTCGIGHAGRDGVVCFTQRRDVRCRNDDAPVTAGIGGGNIVDAIQGHSDSGAIRLITGAGEQQIFALLGGVDDIIARQGIDSDNWRGQRDVNIMRCSGAVTGFIRDGSAQGVVTVHQRANVRGWHTNAPVT